MIGIGTIIDRKGDHVFLEVQPGAQCASCNACDSKTRKPFIVEAQDRIQAQIGESVSFEVKPRYVIGHSFIIFIFPILLLVAGYVIGMSFLPRLETFSEGYAILCSITGLITSLIIIRRYDKWWTNQKKPIAQVIGGSANLNRAIDICNEMGQSH